MSIVMVKNYLILINCVDSLVHNKIIKGYCCHVDYNIYYFYMTCQTQRQFRIYN